MCCWHETNQYLVSKQGRKEITRKQIARTTTCSTSAASALVLSNQDNIKGTCVADVEQIIIWLANNTVNKWTKIMTCSKLTANASWSCKRSETDGICWWHWTGHYLVETYAMTINTSLLKFICWGVWLYKLTYPVIYMLTVNKLDLYQTYNTKYYIESINFDLSQKDNHLWNGMITVLNDNFAQVSATQTEFWCKLRNQIEAKTNKGKCE